jgi:hypothetical protein
MGKVFLHGFFDGESVKKKKRIFSSFVELVQNVADYNELNFADTLPNSSVSLIVLENCVFIKTSNLIKKKDKQSIETRFKRLFLLSLNELNNSYKDALLTGRSLGLIMIRRLEDSVFNYEIIQDGEDYWLNLDLRIDYGEAKH